MTEIPKKKSAFRLKKEKEVIYPSLFNCSLNETNEYWKQLFSDLSRASCPKGITIKNGIIVGSISRKNNITYNFLKDDELTIQTKMKELFANILKCDSIDNKNDNDHIYKVYTEFKKMEWKNIKKKNIKEFLLQNYSFDLKRKYNLPNSKINYIYNLLFDSIYVYKTHFNHDIEYQDGNILNIKDIEYDKNLKNIVNRRLLNDSIIISEDLDNDEEFNDPFIKINDNIEDCDEDMNDDIEDYIYSDDDY